MNVSKHVEFNIERVQLLLCGVCTVLHKIVFCQIPELLLAKANGKDAKKEGEKKARKGTNTLEEEYLFEFHLT